MLRGELFQIVRLYFCAVMKNYNLILHFAALVAMLFLTVYQPAHGIAHYAEAVGQPECHHENTLSKHQITHKHQIEDHCCVCHFNIGNFLSPQIHYFSLFTRIDSGMYSQIESLEIVSYFCGSRFSLRGPPAVFV